MTDIRQAPVGLAPIGPETHTPGHAARGVAAGLGIALGALAAAAVLLYLVSALGTLGVAIAGIAALIPFAIVLLTIRWIDRWEPEPRPALVFAVLWGAGVAVAVALIFDLGVQIALAATGGRPDDFVQAVVQAPLVEESAKGFGVLLLFWVNRRHFDGPVDGIVYAASVAAGFAFSENILYFGRTLVENGIGPEFVFTFVVRGIFSPFAHLLFTACTGFAIGKAAERGGGAAAGFGAYLLGLIPAALLHALWNGGLSLAANTVEYYLFVEVPIFLGALAVVLVVRARERSITRARLGEYADAGWFSPQEVALISTAAGRRQALRWAAAQRDPHGKKVAMKRLIADSTRLGHARQRLMKGRATIGRTPDEQELLARIVADRQVLTTA
ncbi:PrsW family intramembrane metalloprotease [uncultured Amnibacterium sp.]|uniref:PrsW family intramembrane metalloprotease n=1 Tax=uncultured Amnibacterium sp. TaxID=1631851 RepID=UPI0035CC499D